MDPYKFPTCANDRFTGYTTSNKPTVPEVIPDKVVDYTINSIEDRTSTPHHQPPSPEDDDLLCGSISHLILTQVDSVPSLPCTLNAMLAGELKYVPPPFSSAPSLVVVGGGGTANREQEEYYGFTEKWRSRIVDWKYQVVDHYEYSRDIVAVSMSMLDRFCIESSGMTKKHFQLAAMSCLFLAIKLDEPRPMTLESLVDLSKGCFQPRHVKLMEGIVLERLSWMTSPITANVFVRHFLLLLLLPTSQPLLINILEVAVFLTELSVCDSFFISQKSSDTALACILLALESYPVTKSQFEELATGITEVCKLSFESPCVLSCKAKLYDLSNTFTESNSAETSSIPPDCYTSPVPNQEQELKTPARDSISPTGVADADSIIMPTCDNAAKGKGEAISQPPHCSPQMNLPVNKRAKSL